MMKASECVLRSATHADLPRLNEAIEAAVMSWQLPERVKRLSLASYRYDEADMQHLAICVAEDIAHDIIGVGGWEDADPLDLRHGQSGLLLHGLYVLPERHGQGVGGCLLKLAENTAIKDGYDGVLVKAQADSVTFFEKQGYQPLPVEDQGRHYSHRLWKNFTGHNP